MSEFFTTAMPSDKRQWLLERRGLLGASKSPAIAGISKYQTPLQVWAEMVSTEEPDTNDPSDAAHFGNALQPVITNEYQLRHPEVHVQVPNVTHHLKDRPHISASLDGLLHTPTGDEILEVKTAGLRSAQEWGEADDAIPEAYVCQAQHQMLVTGLAVVRFAVLIGGQDYREYSVNRNDDLIGNLSDILDEFWQRVQSRTPPDPVTNEDVRLRWPTDSGATREANDLEISYVRALREVKERKKVIEEEEKYLMADIQRRMGDLSALTMGGENLVTWKTQSKKGYTVAPQTLRVLRTKGI